MSDKPMEDQYPIEALFRVNPHNWKITVLVQDLEAGQAAGSLAECAAYLDGFYDGFETRHDAEPEATSQ